MNNENKKNYIICIETAKIGYDPSLSIWTEKKSCLDYIVLFSEWRDRMKFIFHGSFCQLHACLPVCPQLLALLNNLVVLFK